MSDEGRHPLRREGRMLVIVGSILLVGSPVVVAIMLVQEGWSLERGPVGAAIGLPLSVVMLAIGSVRLARARRGR